MELKIWQAIDVVDNELTMFATDGKRVVIATWTHNHDDIVFVARLRSGFSLTTATR